MIKQKKEMNQPAQVGESASMLGEKAVSCLSWVITTFFSFGPACLARSDWQPDCRQDPLDLFS